jgi:hypothetical protein
MEPSWVIAHDLVRVIFEDMDPFSCGPCRKMEELLVAT